MLHTIIVNIWFLLCASLWLAWFLSAAHDLGIGAQMLLFGLTVRQRAQMLAAMRVFWGYSTLWLVLACVCLTLGYPPAFAMIGVGLRDGVGLLGLGLLLRLAAFLIRERPGSERLLPASPLLMYAGSLLVAFFSGVIIANICAGLAMTAGSVQTYALPMLLRKYDVIAGLLSLSLCLFHGSIWLGIKTSGPFREAVLRVARLAWIAIVVTLTIYLALTDRATRLFNNFVFHPAWFLVLLAAGVALISSRVALARGQHGRALGLGALFTGLLGAVVAIGLYPMVLPSNVATDDCVMLDDVRLSRLSLIFMVALVLIAVRALMAQVRGVRAALGYGATKPAVSDGP